MTDREWNSETLMNVTRAFQPACVIMAAAELAVFDALCEHPQSAVAVAAALHCDLRAVTVLLDALAALQLLDQQDGIYACAAGVADTFTVGAPSSQIFMVRHLANCLRRWDQLAQVVKTGKPAKGATSVLGSDADTESFIEAMNDVSRQTAPPLLAKLDLPKFSHLLDVGGGPATWTIEFLKRNIHARATLFDLPEVLPIARRHVEAAGLRDRVNFVAGDMNQDNLPNGVDLAWISAIVHMNSREQNRSLFRKAHSSLTNGGCVLIRDVVMNATRQSPPMGALFAVNMLVATDGGGTFTLDELREDLEAAGFTDVHLLHSEPSMNSVVAAQKS